MAARPLIVFLHVPKCAGTSLRLQLTQRLHPDALLGLYRDQPDYLGSPAATDTFLRALPDARKRRLRVVIGHQVYRGLGEHFPGRRLRTIALVRDPVQRALSEWAFQRMRHEQGTVFEAAVRRRLARIFAEGTDFAAWLRRTRGADAGLASFFRRWASGRAFDPARVSWHETLRALAEVELGVVEEPRDLIWALCQVGPGFALPGPSSRANRSRPYLGADERAALVAAHAGRFLRDRELYRRARAASRARWAHPLRALAGAGLQRGWALAQRLERGLDPLREGLVQRFHDLDAWLAAGRR